LHGDAAVVDSIGHDGNSDQLLQRAVSAARGTCAGSRHTPVVFRVRNLDGKAMEFESTSLRVEKVVAAKSQGVINVRALKAGRYEFYDDFNEKARGALVVE
jgi:hypothetical protein